MVYLFHGALTNYGLYLSNKLLNEGEKVIGISSALTEDEEDREFTNELFLGRNANFEFHSSTEEIPSDTLEKIDHFISIDGLWFQSKLQEKKMKQVQNMFDFAHEHCPNLRKTLLLTSTEVYGEVTDTVTEKTALNPVTDRGKYSVHVETLYSNVFQPDELEQLIIRLPFLYGDSLFESIIVQRVEEDERVIQMQDILHIDDAIRGIWLALNQHLGKGQYIFQLTSGETNALSQYLFSRHIASSIKSDQVIFSYNKSQEKFGFSPIESTE